MGCVRGGCDPDHMTRKGDGSYGAWPHPSGVGCFLVPPVGAQIRIKRSDVRNDGVDGEAGVIFKGYLHTPRRFLDLDVPLNKAVTYTFEVMNRTTGEYEVFDTVEGHLEPQLSYSAIEDADTYDVANPRDALMIFYSTRLAQLVREGALYVRGAAENKSNHVHRYPVTAAYEGRSNELPTISVDHAGSNGHLGDLGGTYTEEDVQIEMVAAAATIEERDSLASAIRGLLKDTDSFMEDVGMMLPMMAHFEMGVEPVNPPLYTLRWSIMGTVTTWHGNRDLPWEILPLYGWV